ncbi:MAG TPA: TetR/AcrR family transcriptional regulator, partial [Ktedonobacteraceae bacterium]|nr:TetR/AcrR family transcriptional regulator [Ktedonobacteraceae bacterium]
LRALAALDPDFEQVIRTRDGWRRKGVQVIIQRIVEKQMPASSKTRDEIVDVLFTLTSFETFDSLAGSAHSPQEVVPVVQKLARAAIELNE